MWFKAYHSGNLTEKLAAFKMCCVKASCQVVAAAECANGMQNVCVHTPLSLADVKRETDFYPPALSHHSRSEFRKYQKSYIFLKHNKVQLQVSIDQV